MNEEILITLEDIKVDTFERKNGKIGQKILFMDDRLYRHEIDCVDNDVFDFTKYNNADKLTIACSVRNQKVTIKFGDKGSRDTYVNVFTANYVK